MSTIEQPHPMSEIVQDYRKRLMVFGGRASGELASNIARHLAGRPRRRHPEDLLQRRGLLPLRGVDPRRRRLHRPVDRRQRDRGDDPERRPHGAAGDDRRRAGCLRPPDHRRDALVRLRAPGQEVGAARADLGPDRGQVPRGRRRRPRPHHGPPRRPGPGLLPRPPGPHDRDADAGAVRRRHGLRRGAGDRLPGCRPREDGPQLRPQDRHPLGRHGEGAPRPAGRRDRLRRR